MPPYRQSITRVRYSVLLWSSVFILLQKNVKVGDGSSVKKKQQNCGCRVLDMHRGRNTEDVVGSKCGEVGTFPHPIRGHEEKTHQILHVKY